MKLRKLVSIFMMLIISCGIFADNLCVFAETQPVADSSGKPDAFTDGFENGLGEWFSFGAIPIEIDNTVSRTGSNSLLATGRTIEWHGPSVNLTDKLIFGETYNFSLWVRHNEAKAQSIKMTIKYTNVNNVISYKTLGEVSCEYGEWGEITAVEQPPTNTLEMVMYVHSLNTTMSFNIDDLNIWNQNSQAQVTETTTASSNASEKEPLVTAGSDGVLVSNDFESGVGDWKPRGTEKVEINKDKFNSGKSSLYVSDRTKVWQGPKLNIDPFLQKEVTYKYSVFVMYEGDEYDGSHEFVMQMGYTMDGTQRYQTICAKKVKKGEWTELKGEYTAPNEASNAFINIQTKNLDENAKAEPTDLASFYMDDFVMSDNNAVSESGFNVLFIIIPGVVVILIVLLILYLKMSNKQKQVNEVMRFADTDVMTNALNRNAYERKIRSINNNLESYKKVRVATCDVNFLKYVNDTYGHENGDDIIIRCSQLLRDAVGSEGLVYRTGGDEFFCISSVPFEEKLLANFEKEAKENDNEYPFSIAVGFAKFEAADVDFSDVIKRSDKNMYANKEKMKSENPQFSRQ